MLDSRFPAQGRPFPILKALVAAMSVQLAGTAQAATFSFADGDGSITFDSTFSAGLLMRTQAADPRNVGIVNGGTSRSVNEDDGNLNYEKGEVVSEVLKGLHDFDISYGKTGFFARFGYAADFAAQRKEELGTIAHKRLDFDMELYDAYLRTEFMIADRRLNIRLGKQVVSWGEGALMQGGINVINPVDLTRLRAPGSELKEAFIPVPMVWASQQLTDNLTLEAFYQFKFEPFKIDPHGTFFSTTDVFSPGGTASYTGFGRTPDHVHGTPKENSTIARGDDQLARDDGQFGVALRWLVGNTELGLYGINYHSRTPIASTLAGTPSEININLPPLLRFNYPQRNADAARIFAEYPEDIQLFGLSFNTPGPFGLALGGEYSFRPNLPLQIATPELVLAALGLPNQAGQPYDLAPTPAGDRLPEGGYIRGYRDVKAHQLQLTALKAFPNVLGAAQAIALLEAAYVYLDLPEGIKFNGPGVYLPSRQSGATLASALGLPLVDFPYPNPIVANGSVQPGDQGYATKSSWGLRAVGRLEYPDVFAGINLLPRVIFAWDVKGVSPFLTEDVKSASLGLTATYNQVWSADISYTAFFGGRVFKGTDCLSDLTTIGGVTLPGGSGNDLCNSSGLLGAALGGLTGIPDGQVRTYESIANPNIDRDFLAASISYAF